VEAPDLQNPELHLMAVSKTTLEQACLEEAKRQFTQAVTTPLLKCSDATGLGNLQIGSLAFLQILEGTFPFEKINNPYTRKLLQYLCRPVTFREVLPIPDKEYKLGWLYACKTTASSLSGVHFGHYMAGVKAVLTEKINHLMATIPLLTGISPE